jgi:cytochrome c-type biogenesis protein CcmE
VRKAAKLVLLVLLVGAGGALAFAGAMPEAYAGVGAVVDDPAAFEGREVGLKATVVPGTLDRAAEPVRFLVADGARTLEVRWDPAHPLPDHEAGGTIEGRNVVVHGTLARDESGVPYLIAHEMQVGCASKYRPE